MYDVVIVGGGPIGLFLACELGRAGSSVVVLERAPEPHSPWRVPPLGLRGLNAGSIEAFYRRGMLASLLEGSDAEVGAGSDGDARPPRSVSHFAGIGLDASKIEPAALPLRLPSPAMDGMISYLDSIETMLAEHATKLGVEIRRGAGVTALSQDGEKVSVRAGDLDFEGRWVVGCDGGRSTVRGLAGFGFAGTEPQLTGYLMMATVSDGLRPGFNVTPTGMYLKQPPGGYVAMMDFDGGAFDRSRELTAAHLQDVLRRVSGTGVTVSDVQLASSFTDRAMQASTYRRGRVLLAGDAAHIHSPLGGQGLNLGLGDAMNLGWKLAATVRGSAPSGLLDTYTAERHPIGARVLDWSRAQVAVMRPSPYAAALQSVMRDLLATRDATTYVWERTSGTTIKYDLGDEQPLVGRNAPDFRLADGTALGDLLQDGQAVCLDFSPEQSLRDAAAAWGDRIRYASGPARDDLGHGAVFVRPDGIVAWAGDPDPAAFEKAARRWLGNPPVQSKPSA